MQNVMDECHKSLSESSSAWTPRQETGKIRAFINKFGFAEATRWPGCQGVKVEAGDLLLQGVRCCAATVSGLISHKPGRLPRQILF
jgi:hypothetical protein